MALEVVYTGEDNFQKFEDYIKENSDVARPTCGMLGGVMIVGMPVIETFLVAKAIGRASLSAINLLAVAVTCGQWDRAKNGFLIHTALLGNDVHEVVGYPLFAGSLCLGAINPNITLACLRALK